MRILFLIAIAGILGWFILNTEKPTLPSQSPTQTPLTSVTPGVLIPFEDNTYRVYIQKVVGRELTLIPNFSEKKSASTMFAENDCDYGINGGFYTKEEKPLGLYFANGAYINKTPHSKTLFNGFVHKTRAGSFLITTEVPNYSENGLDFAFQSGPLFSPERKLTIQNDEMARRILIGQSQDKNYYFLAVTESNNVHSGPYLADLPKIILQYNSSQLLTHNPTLLSILNLDGGSASSFFAQDGTRLEELVPVGSFLCGKNP